MKLVYDLLPEPILFSENSIQTLIIENPLELRRVISLLRQEAQGNFSGFYLSDENNLLPFSSSVLLILNPFELDFGDKKLKSALFKELQASDIYSSDLYGRLLEDLSVFAQELSLCCDCEVTYTEITAPDALLKLFDFRFNPDKTSFSEKLLSFVRLQHTYGGRKLFIFLNLKAFLSENELLLFCKSLYYEKIPVLLIEDCQRVSRLPGEKCTIIDKDLCIL